MPLVTAALLLLLSLAASAQDIEVEKEELDVLGWNDACSVALTQRVYPKFGQAIHGEPISSRTGTVTIAPGSEKSTSKWFHEARGVNSWSPAALEKVARALRKLGYTRTGYREVVRAQVSKAQPGLYEAILSTANLSLRPGHAFPDAGWRWSGADYSPLGTCALLLFETESPPARHDWRLVRVYNPRARLDRSRAHAANSRLLFADGELEGAVAEAGTAASLAPESAVARYVYSTLLAMSGREDEAMRELKAATTLDPKRAADAKNDRDFDSLRKRRDFRDLVGASYLDRISR